MADLDRLIDTDTDDSLHAVAACLRQASLDVEAAIASGDTPLAKIDRVAQALEDLGNRLDNLADWIPATPLREGAHYPARAPDPTSE